MAKIKKKGTAGAAKNFITRTQAVRKLQITLPDFRRLCIFKGIYPREPRSKKKVSKSSTPSTTFYYTRDIQFLLHEPLLAKFREHKALSKKIARSLGRGEIGDAARLEKSASPKLSLDHIIKERYPTFVDALRDLDDALTLLHLFASLPSTSKVPPDTIALCQRLCHEFQHYIITTHCLQKSFLSIKGIYYQATINGQSVMWIVPYRFVQRMTGDVDFRIMGTFVEFYTTLLGFVNFRLYSSIGLIYPPRFDASRDAKGGELSAFSLEGRKLEDNTAQPNDSSDQNAAIELSEPLRKQIENIAEEVHPPDSTRSASTNKNDGQESADAASTDDFVPISEDADTLLLPAASSNQAATLFADMTVFLSRETPRGPLEFLLRAFGCKRVGWPSSAGDGAFTSDAHDPSITHQIIDRPVAGNGPYNDDSSENTELASNGVAHKDSLMKIPGRVYVQPQWVWDCINELRLLRPDHYAPGETLPPHLSPWVKPSKGEYDPKLPLAEQEEEGEAEDDEAYNLMQDEASGPGLRSEANANALLSENTADEHGMEIAASSGDESKESESQFEDLDRTASSIRQNAAVSPNLDAEIDGHQADLEREAAGHSFDPAATRPLKGILKKPSQRQKNKQQEAEELERRKMMMSRKKRVLHDKMMYSNEQKNRGAEKLRQKKRRIDRDALAKSIK